MNQPPPESTDVTVYRILVADDETPIQELYQSVLDNSNGSISSEIDELEGIVGTESSSSKPADAAEQQFEVTIVGQGEEAIERVKESLEQGIPYTIAFLDIRMPPGIDGVEAAKQIQLLDERIYIVFVTAYSDHSIEEINRSTNYSSILLRKPFHKEEIQQLAYNLCHKWQKDRELEQVLVDVEENARKDSEEAKSEFYASMKQELRGPISAIIANSEKLLNEEESSEKRDLLYSIAAAGRSQLSMMNDILDLSKIEKGNFTINIKPFDLNQLIANINFIFTEHARNAGLQFQVNQLAMPEYKLIGDMQRINQILINMIGNAIKFTESGAIVVTVWNSEEHLSFSVKDTGIGIPEEKRSLIFNMFGKVQPSEEHCDNCGLGLYISMTLAHLMGGSVEVESELGKGSTFTLTLPYQESNAAIATDSSAIQPSKTELQGKVLVVDDEPFACMLLRKMLEPMGLSVTTSSSGSEAIDMVDADPSFDLILMDLMMPGISGIETAHLIRNRKHEVPIVLISSDYSDRFNDLIQQQVINDFLEKPTHRVALHESLSQFLSPSQGGDQITDVTEVSDHEALTEAMKEIFKNELIENHRRLSNAFKHQDWPKMREVANTLKGSGSSFGQPEITELGKDICLAIDNKEFYRIIGLTIQLVSAIRNALDDF